MFKPPSCSGTVSHAFLVFLQKFEKSVSLALTKRQKRNERILKAHNIFDQPVTKMLHMAILLPHDLFKNDIWYRFFIENLLKES